MSQRFFALPTLMLALVTGASDAAMGRGMALMAATAALTLDQAAAQVRRDSGGRILAAERSRRNGRPMYRFKVLTPNGRVRKLWVDPGGEPSPRQDRGRGR